ncbi:Sec-independent protein translocase protein TatB [compost metagenome]
MLGPERLPGAARTAGLWIGRLKRSFNAIKSEVEREIGADEIRRQLHNEQILDMERQLKSQLTASEPAPAAAPVESPSGVPQAPAATPISPEPPPKP